jgi:signal transduction histidine kinase
MWKGCRRATLGAITTGGMPDKLHLEDAQLRELMHLMSHDLRNPLAAIVTNLEFAKRLLSRMAVDPDLAESVEDSVTACDVMRQIVGNFDVLVKGSDLPVTLSDLDIAKTVSEVVKRCRDRAQQASLTLDVNAPEPSPRSMLDKTLFSLAIENLVANSIQHAPRRSTVTVTMAVEAQRALVVIADAGAAIPEPLRERALGPDGHSPGGRTEGTRYGRGLGLLAAHAAATACGCTLEASGVAVSGEDRMTSVFTVGVPLLAGG